MVNLYIVACEILPLFTWWNRPKQCHVQLQVRAKKSEPYIPDFSKAFQHICFHTGGGQRLQPY